MCDATSQQVEHACTCMGLEMHMADKGKHLMTHAIQKGHAGKAWCSAACLGQSVCSYCCAGESAAPCREQGRISFDMSVHA